MTIRLPPPQGLFRTTRLFLRPVAMPDPKAEALFAVDHPLEGRVGAVRFGPDRVLATQVNCWIDEPYRRRGYATEVLIGALTWARDAWGRRCVTARHFADDPAAARALIKAGFLYTGRTEMRASCARSPSLARWMVWLA
jgi:RimJ/RimL family protein N-acetyltransferase